MFCYNDGNASVTQGPDGVLKATASMSRGNAAFHSTSGHPGQITNTGAACAAAHAELERVAINYRLD